MFASQQSQQTWRQQPLKPLLGNARVYVHVAYAHSSLSDRCISCKWMTGNVCGDCVTCATAIHVTCCACQQSSSRLWAAAQQADVQATQLTGCINVKFRSPVVSVNNIEYWFAHAQHLPCQETARPELSEYSPLSKGSSALKLHQAQLQALSCQPAVCVVGS